MTNQEFGNLSPGDRIYEKNSLRYYNGLITIIDLNTQAKIPYASYSIMKEDKEQNYACPIHYFKQQFNLLPKEVSYDTSEPRLCYKCKNNNGECVTFNDYCKDFVKDPTPESFKNKEYDPENEDDSLCYHCRKTKCVNYHLPGMSECDKFKQKKSRKRI